MNNKSLYRLTKTIALFGAAMVLLLVVGRAAAEQPLPTTAEVTRVMDEMWRASSSHAHLKMVVKTQRGTRELSMESWTAGKDQALSYYLQLSAFL